MTVNNPAHSSLTGENLHEPYQYIASSDPGVVGAGKYWLDTSGDPYILKRRNAGDSGWVTVGSSATGDVSGPGSSTDGNFAAFDGTDGETIKDSGKSAADFATDDHTHTRYGQAVFYWYGDLETGEHEAPICNRLGTTATITGVYLHVKTGNEPTGAAIIADVHSGGTTIFTTQSNRPQVAAAGTSGNSTTIEAASWANGAELAPALDQVGSTLPGTGLVMEVAYTY